MKRTRQSARFDPYYKIQWYDAVSLTWRDIQQAFSTTGEAEAQYLPDKKCRLIEITMQGRHPISAI